MIMKTLRMHDHRKHVTDILYTISEPSITSINHNKIFCKAVNKKETVKIIQF